MNAYNLNRFSAPERLATALAAGVGAALMHGVAANGAPRLVVSGGRTPICFFEALSHSEIAWGRVTILLADERWVPDTDPRSNAGLVRQHLLQNSASAARFEPYFDAALSVGQAAMKVAGGLMQNLAPLDAVILGLGNDGHTASLFPDAPELADALAENAPGAMAMHPPSQPEARLTLTPAPLSSAHFVALHIEGAQKHVTLERAAHGGPEDEMPIRAILQRAIKPVETYWCP
jgi:6-phosphogluconolactonase